MRIGHRHVPTLFPAKAGQGRCVSVRAAVAHLSSILSYVHVVLSLLVGLWLAGLTLAKPLWCIKAAQIGVHGVPHDQSRKQAACLGAACQPDVVSPKAVKTRLVPNLPIRGRLSLGAGPVPQHSISRAQSAAESRLADAANSASGCFGRGGVKFREL